VRKRNERGRVPGGEKREASLVCRVLKSDLPGVCTRVVLDLTAPAAIEIAATLQIHHN
jgi:hypothetical protein